MRSERISVLKYLLTFCCIALSFDWKDWKDKSWWILIMEKSLNQDSLDMKQIDQLHEVVLNLSKNCFEIKKLCLAVLSSGLLFINFFTSKNIDLSHFIAGAIIISFFYLLDVQCFFYQVKIRIRMQEIVDALVKRSISQIVVIGFGIPLSKYRLHSNRLFHSCFNSSMLFYWMLGLLDLLLFILHKENLF